MGPLYLWQCFVVSSIPLPELFGKVSSSLPSLLPSIVFLQETSWYGNGHQGQLRVVDLSNHPSIAGSANTAAKLDSPPYRDYALSTCARIPTIVNSAIYSSVSGPLSPNGLLEQVSSGNEGWWHPGL